MILYNLHYYDIIELSLSWWTCFNKIALIIYIYIYSQTCIKRSPLGQRKSGLLRQVTSYINLKTIQWYHNNVDYIIFLGWNFKKSKSCQTNGNFASTRTIMFSYVCKQATTRLLVNCWLITSINLLFMSFGTSLWAFSYSVSSLLAIQE
jgi:hypothetical protein